MSFEDMAAAAQDPKNLPVEFEFDTTLVRTIAKEGQAWFVAKDVCDILEIGDPSKAVDRLEEDETGTTTIRTTAGPREMLTVNESGLYSLIFTSRKPEAKRFRKWVTNEVLPAIQQTGRYVGYSENDPDPIIVWSKLLGVRPSDVITRGFGYRLSDRRSHKPFRLPRPQPPRALLHGDGPLLLLGGPARAGLRPALVATRMVGATVRQATPDRRLARQPVPRNRPGQSAL
jgi:prophage antirepressor-like protein